MPGPCSYRPGTKRWACRAPWDQQWSLRIQQILAFETDLLEYGDIFAGSTVVEGKTRSIKNAAWAEVERVTDMGGVISALGYIKEQLVASHYGAGA